MADIRIDDAVVQRLLTTQLTGLADVDVFFPGEPLGEGNSPLGAWVDYELTPADRNNTVDSDLATIVIVVEVGLGPTQTDASTYSVGAALSQLSAALEEKCLIDVATNHQVDTRRAVRRVAGRVADDGRRILALVTVQADVKRTSGETREDHLE